MLLGIRDRKVNECGAVLCTKTNGAWQRGRGHTPLKFFWDHGPGYCGGGVRVFHFDSFVYHKRTCVYEVYGVECAAALLPGLFRPPFVVSKLAFHTRYASYAHSTDVLFSPGMIVFVVWAIRIS